MNTLPNRYWTRSDAFQGLWSSLENHARIPLKIVDLFEDPARIERYVAEGAGLELDFSKTPVTDAILKDLVALAESAGLTEARQALLSGKPVNHTEARPALHTLLRAPEGEPVMVEGTDARAEVRAALEKLERFVSALHAGDMKGATGETIRDVVSIGIGGSFLGPKVAVDALRPQWVDQVRVHFVSNVDGNDLYWTLKDLNPATTLFIIQSKSFTTQETLLNARSALAWLAEAGIEGKAISAHLAGVTANVDKALAFGLPEDALFPMWDWVGGRYSLWSAIGLPIACQVGMPVFRELLAGARAMDEHFASTPSERNLPVLLGMLGVWYQNFLDYESEAVIPYDQTLADLTAHLQQLDMESNGKSVNRDGEPVKHPTGAVLWGGPGTNGQHAYHQLIHQGTRKIAVNFILARKPVHPLVHHHDYLISNCLAQAQALMVGRPLEATGNPHRVIPGNRPSHLISLPQLDAFHLGALIALYEHKVFVQALIWDINAFDQWGVELGKELSDNLLPALQGKTDVSGLDPSTAWQVKRYREA